MKQLSLPGNTRQITVTFQVNAIGRDMSRRLELQNYADFNKL